MTSKLIRRGRRRNRRGQAEKKRAFQFDGDICATCPLHPTCVKGKSGKGRTVSLHPQEALLQEARAFQQSEAYAPYRKLRQVVEHRIARLVQLGVRKARYFGRHKTLFQLLMAATVANLHLVATKSAQGEGLDRDGRLASLLPSSLLASIRTGLRHLLTVSLSQPVQRWAFRLGF